MKLDAKPSRAGTGAGLSLSSELSLLFSSFSSKPKTFARNSSFFGVRTRCLSQAMVSILLLVFLELVGDQQ